MKIEYKILWFFVVVPLFFSLLFWTYAIIVYYGTEAETAKLRDNVPANKVLGGIVPHHLFVRDRIASFFAGVQKKEYDTVVLIGPDHFSAAKQKMTTSIADWDTSRGKLKANKGAISAIVKSSKLTVEEAPFKREHSIFNLVPFIKEAFARKLVTLLRT